jgi:adenylosuccinate synthase
VPADVEVLSHCEPVYAEFEGWRTPITSARKWRDLPAKAQAYLRAIAELSAAKLGIVSVGPGREQTILV